MIITQAQRMTNYAMAAYGTCAAFAKRLGRDDEARALTAVLEATHTGDQAMTRIAEGEVNPAAARH